MFGNFTFEPIEELQGLIEEGQRDRDLLTLPLPLEEALAIWARTRKGLLWVAENDHDEVRGRKIRAFVEEREKAMLRLRVKARPERKAS